MSKFLELTRYGSGTKILVNIKNIDSVSIYSDKVKPGEEGNAYTKIEMTSGSQYIVLETIENIFAMLSPPTISWESDVVSASSEETV